MRLRTLVVVLAMVVSACSAEGQELLDAFIDEIFDQPLLTESEDPGVRAAGSTVDDKSNEDRANTQIERALKPDKTPDQRIRHAENAILARPGDPLYYVYLALFRGATGNFASIVEALSLARGLVSQQFAHIQDPERRDRETNRRLLELSMEAVLANLRATPEGSLEQQSATATYCGFRSEYQAANFMADSIAGQAQWDFVIAHDLCP